MKSSPFQIVLIGLFIFLAIVGLVFFATSGRKGKNQAPAVVMWGEMSKDNFDAALDIINSNDPNFLRVTYVEKTGANFIPDLVEAIASGSGPDIVLLSNDLLFAQRNKIISIPYDVLSAREFKDSYVQAGEIFLGDEGVLGVPFQIDPLVMYWNRSIFSSAGVSSPPVYWDEFASLVPKLVKKDASLNISISPVALGEFRNINNAKGIISALVMQAGNPIVAKSVSGVFESSFSDRLGYTVAPADAVMSFFTGFADPAKPLYSWNRSLPNSLDMFARGDLAVYFGLASELPAISSKNPNLNFDVSLIPQARDSKEKITFGEATALVIVKSAKDPNGAWQAVSLLSSKEVVNAFSSVNSLPPVRRDLLASKPKDAYMSVFYDSALISRNWLDPNPIATNNSWRDMVESILSGRYAVSEAVNRAGTELDSLLN